MVIGFDGFSFAHDLARENDSQRTRQMTSDGDKHDILQSQKIADKTAHQHRRCHAPEDGQTTRAVLLLSEMEGLPDFLHHVAMQAECESRGHQGDATANEQPARINHAYLLLLEFIPKNIGKYQNVTVQALESVVES